MSEDTAFPGIAHIPDIKYAPIYQYWPKKKFECPIKRVEHLNVDAIKYVAEHCPYILYHTIWDKKANDSFKDDIAPSFYPHMSFLTLLDKVQHNGCVPVTYKYSDRISVMGRVYPTTCSVGPMPGDVRALFTSHLYVDCDIQNCQPVLLSNILRTLNMPCKDLDDMVANREAWYQRNQISKQQFIAQLYNDHLYLPCMSSIHKALYCPDTGLLAVIMRDLSILWQWSVKQGERKKKDGCSKKGNPAARSALSALMQDFERIVLQVALEYLNKNKKVSVDVLIHDGFLVRSTKDGATIEDSEREMLIAIPGLEDFVYEKVNVKLKYALKSHKENLMLWYKRVDFYKRLSEQKDLTPAAKKLRITKVEESEEDES